MQRASRLFPISMDAPYGVFAGVYPRGEIGYSTYSHASSLPQSVHAFRPLGHVVSSPAGRRAGSERRLRSGMQPLRPHSSSIVWAIAFCAAALGLISLYEPFAGLFGAGAVGALFVLHSRNKSLLLAAALGAGMLLPNKQGLVDYFLLIAEVLAAAIAPRGAVSALLQAPRWSWMLAMVLGTIAVCAMATELWLPASVIASLCAFYLGAGAARHLAMVDARLLAWGEEGLFAVTRDLLLGRVTSGMLHDLAQPLNVISMANGNLGYIVDHLEIDEENRRQITERVSRIASHTQTTASILSLFRWFGRDGSDDPAELSVRSALDRAVAATRSNVRHYGVAVELDGNALDYPLPERHGALEVMAVAALLCAFASFLGRDGEKSRGKVALQATLSPAHVVVTVECTDADGHAVPGKVMDHATLWLVEQVAHEASGDFRCLARDSQPVRFVIRLGRDDA